MRNLIIKLLGIRSQVRVSFNDSLNLTRSKSLGACGNPNCKLSDLFDDHCMAEMPTAIDSDADPRHVDAGTGCRCPAKLEFFSISNQQRTGGIHVERQYSGSD